MSSLFIVRVLLGLTIDDSSKWLPWSTPLRHRYGYHGVTPYPYVIAIYRTRIYYRPDIATWRSRDHDTFIFIVRVLLGQTIDDSSKWLPWSNPPRHRNGYHGVTPHPYVIAIYSKVLPIPPTQ